jgi:tRNA pseudouridine38-40 synthase
MTSPRNIRLVLEYCGTGYHGWQVQPGVLTIQEVVESSIRSLTQQPCRLTAAGRTDAGVHAFQQVANFITRSRLPVETFFKGLNALLPPDVRVLKVDDVSRDFHARYAARSKRYQYRIWSGSTFSAFHYPYAWWIKQPLDLFAMTAAADYLVGQHDFGSFRSANCEARNPVREVIGCGWERQESLLLFWIEANAFLKYMVRTVVGTLVEVGLGKRKPEEMEALLAAGDRTQAGMTVPARGLFLAAVHYPEPWQLEAGNRRLL